MLKNDRYRPRFHFSPTSGWMNDPNGLVRTAAGYHAFFQHNPTEKTWGNIVWGHAFSEDLLIWRDLGVSLVPEESLMAFSGSAVECPLSALTGEDSDGLALVAAYTGHETATEIQDQRIVYSVDDGISWRPLGKEPAIPERVRHFRDPGLFWHVETQSWILVVIYAVEHAVAFYRSPDLRGWQRHGTFQLDEPDGVECECPELVRLADPQTPGEDLWLLKVDLSTGAVTGGSGGKYFLGRFDGYGFESLPIVAGPPEARNAWGWVDYGKDFYAAQVFRNNDKTQTPVWLGWASNWQYARQTPTDPWRGCLSCPRELSLAVTGDGYLLCQKPFFPGTAGDSRSLPWSVVDSEAPFPEVNPGHSFELRCRFSDWTAEEFGVDVAVGADCRTRLGFRPAQEEIFLDRRRSGDVSFSTDFPEIFQAPLRYHDEIDVHLLVDRSIVEVFVNGGQTVLSSLIYPPDDATRLSLYARSGRATISSAEWSLLGGPEVPIK